jgi:hypothetical protein
MNTEDAKELFPTIDHWLSFNELADQRNAILEDFVRQATRKVREHFNECPAPGWCMEPWGADYRDTKWYLEEYGPNSLFLCYGWEYELQLRLHDPQVMDTHAITKALESNDYMDLKHAFQRIDRYMQVDSKLMEKRNFRFGGPHDGSLSYRELAWYAGLHRDEFVSQAVAKIERFVRNENVTAQIRKLNRIGRDAKIGK